MKRTETSVSFRQMTDRGEGYGYSLLMAVFGLLFLGAGVTVLMQGKGMGLAMILFALVFILLSGSTLMPYLRSIEFAGDEIRLKLGFFILARYPAAQIQTLARGTVHPNAKWAWEPEIILLSPRSGQQILEIGKIVLDSAREFPAMHPHVGADAGDPKVLTDGFIKSKFMGLRLERGEGLWLEYDPERAAQLKILLPHGQDLMIF